MPDHFVTEFGHRIDFVPGYFKRNSFYANWFFAVSKGEPLSFHMPAKDWVLFSSLIYFLERHKLLRPRGRGIDLGGAEGTVIRLFRASGLISHATNLDILDYSDITGDAYFEQFIDIICNIDATEEKITSAVDWAKYHLAHFGGTSRATGLHFDFPKPATLDQNLVADVYEASGEYDLVVANALLEFTDLNESFPKIRSMLSKDGLFIGSFNTAWGPFDPSGLVGDFPYLAQRLSQADLKRYYAEARPQFLQVIDERLTYFHRGKQRPTLQDWITLAKKHGLRVVAFERVTPVKHRRVQDCAPDIFQAPWFDLEEVLRDIHHLRPDVTVDDLMTSALRIAIVPV